MTRHELYVLQATYSHLPRPIPLIFSVEKDRQITRTNWKKLKFDPPTKKQLSMLTRLGYTEKPPSRISASQILHEITQLAHYEAGKLEIQEKFKLVDLSASIQLHDIENTQLKKSQLAALETAVELYSDTDPYTPFWTVLTLRNKKEICVKYEKLKEQIDDIKQLYPYLAREKRATNKQTKR